MHIDFKRRKARKGQGLIPPNPTHWGCEHNGLDLRNDMGVELDSPLDVDSAFSLLPHVTVTALGAVPAAVVFVDHWRNSGKAALSGVSFQLPDGHELVIYNDAHPLTRIRSTLMEEFFHIWLEHPRSVLRVMETAGPQRTIDQTVEYEAYSSAAAALVPYKPLKALLRNTESLTAIGRRFRVSPALVRYRANVTKLAKHVR